jgi:hypothetical protein
VLAKVVQSRYGIAVPSEELRSIAPATVPAVLLHLATKHDVPREDGDERRLALALADRLLRELDGVGMDLSEIDRDRIADQLLQNLHSPAPMEEVMNRFTVKALTDYIAGKLGSASRLTAGA